LDGYSKITQNKYQFERTQRDGSQEIDTLENINFFGFPQNYNELEKIKIINTVNLEKLLSTTTPATTTTTPATTTTTSTTTTSTTTTSTPSGKPDATLIYNNDYNADEQSFTYTFQNIGNGNYLGKYSLLLGSDNNSTWKVLKYNETEVYVQDDRPNNSWYRLSQYKNDHTYKELFYPSKRIGVTDTTESKTLPAQTSVIMKVEFTNRPWQEPPE
jgi:hypothetical protein